MKKALKLLTLAMIFAMPLAGCGDNEKPKDEEEQHESQDDDDDDEGGGGSGDCEHAGTKADPYSINDAYLVWSDLDSREATNAVYVKGKVKGSVTQNKDNQRVRLYLTDSTSSEELYVVDAYGAGKSALSASSIKAGDELLVTGSLKKFSTDDGDLFEICFDTTKKADCQVLTINGKDTGNGGSGGGGGDSGGGGGSGQITGDGVLFDFASLSGVSGSAGGVSFTSSKESGASEPAYNDSNKELRLYANNKLTISASGKISKINFKINTCSCNKTKVDFASATPGSYSKGTWTGSANEVTFTCPASGQVHIQKIEVILGEGGGGGSGEGGGDGDVYYSEEGEAFFKEILEQYLGYEPEFGVDYDDDEGLYTSYDCDDLETEVDSVYEMLQDSYDCDEPSEGENSTYGFTVYDDSGDFEIDIWSGEEDGYFIEFDLWDYSVFNFEE